jgi:hypothetical protein
MVRPKEWVLIIPRTAVEGGEDILMRNSTPLAINQLLTIPMPDRALEKAEQKQALSWMK